MLCWVLPSGGTALIGMVGIGTLESGISEKEQLMVRMEAVRPHIFISQLRCACQAFPTAESNTQTQRY